MMISKPPDLRARLPSMRVKKPPVDPMGVLIRLWYLEEGRDVHVGEIVGYTLIDHTMLADPAKGRRSYPISPGNPIVDGSIYDRDILSGGYRWWVALTLAPTVALTTHPFPHPLTPLSHSFPHPLTPLSHSFPHRLPRLLSLSPTHRPASASAKDARPGRPRRRPRQERQQEKRGQTRHLRIAKKIHPVEISSDAEGEGHQPAAPVAIGGLRGILLASVPGGRPGRRGEGERGEATEERERPPAQQAALDVCGGGAVAGAGGI